MLISLGHGCTRARALAGVHPGMLQEYALYDARREEAIRKAKSFRDWQIKSIHALAAYDMAAAKDICAVMPACLPDGVAGC